jgi:hypothetical protein
LRLNLLNYPLRNSRAWWWQRKKITFDNYHLAFNDYWPIVFQQSFTWMN